MLLLPDLLNRRQVLRVDLGVSSFSAATKSVEGGDDVTAFLARENMDGPFSFLAGAEVDGQTSSPFNPRNRFRSADPLSILGDKAFDDVLTKRVEKLNRDGVDSSIADRCSSISVFDTACSAFKDRVLGNLTELIGCDSVDFSVACSLESLGEMELNPSFADPGNWSAEMAAPRTGQLDHCKHGLSNSTIFRSAFPELPRVRLPRPFLELGGVRTSKVPAASGAWLGEIML